MTIEVRAVNSVGAGASESARVTPVRPGGSVRAATVRQGGTQTVDAVGFLPGEQVTARWSGTSTVLGQSQASTQGRVTMSFAVPRDASVGRRAVDLLGTVSGTKVTLSFAVTGR